MSLYVGIDLGTTFSVVCHKDSQFQFVKDESGDTIIPSVVTYFPDASVRFVGKEAVENEDNFPQETVRSSKRFIGQNLGDLISNSNEQKEINPSDVARDILLYLKHLTETSYNKKIDGIVLTVPAYFNQNQRHETKQAAEKAGLNVLRIVNEPTAAALAYGDQSKKNELVLVYDLGGGTFDVTLLQLTDDNVYQVLSTSGDTKLGGDDFDNIIVEKFKKSLPKDFKPFKDFEVRVKHFAEEIKKQMNYKSKIYKTLKYCGTVNGKIYHHNFDIEQNDFKQSINNLLLKTKSHVLNALNDANKKISHLDKIILVGGSTKSMFVRNFVIENFKTKVFYDIDPDLTVAAGAATLAKSLCEFSSDNAILIDVTPLSLGIEIKGGLFNKIIPRNTHLPVTSLQEFVTSEDNQQYVTIKVYQGEKPIAKQNELLGEFVLSGFPLRPKGQTKIVVQFEIDVSGLINVLAYDKLTGIKSEITLQPLSSSEIFSVLDNLEVIDKNEQTLRDLEISELIETANTFIITINNEDMIESYKESLDSVKDDLEKLKTFVYSIQHE